MLVLRYGKNRFEIIPNFLWLIRNEFTEFVLRQKMCAQERLRRQIVFLSFILMCINKTSI